ncbi:MAG: HD domain-containing protein [Candidatus Obscuribacterales bacterium]|nr:HD domain-containing protein [Candidatus Obscuribacterales bacterium]
MNAKTDKLENKIFRITGLQESKPGGLSRGPKVRLTLQNKAYAGLAAISWNELSGFAIGQVVRVSGDLGKYQEKPQLQIKSIVQADSYDATDLVPTYSGDLKALEARLQACIALIKHEKLRRIVTTLLDKGTELGKKFRLAPASPADISHEPYLHGLWQHTLEVTEFAHGMALQAMRMRPEEYASINICHLVFAGLLHDIGKTTSYEYGNDGIKFALAGRLNGHLIEGYAIMRDALLKEGGFTATEIDRLLHIVASHHGAESDNPPRTIEAMLVHKADSIASQLGSTYGKPHESSF